jgi:hypothetical protein
MQVVAAVLLGVVGWQAGEHAQARLSNHDGYWLLESRVEEGLDATALGFQRPRRVTVVLIDGLRADAARGMASYARLARMGRCWETDIPVPTVSQPVYVLLSTGVEADRSGVRSNGGRGAAAAEPIWAVAREAGWRVVVWSELDWWQKLFPGAFDRYEVRAREENYFALATAAEGDLVLVHPLFVDEAGHDHGASSPEYAAAVARADRELGAFLDVFDPGQDVVFVTADHGHTARGGHGGAQPEVRRVRSCMAGRSVRPATDARPHEPWELPRLIALHAGLRFPRHTRAPLGDTRHFDALDAAPSYERARLEAWERLAQDQASALGDALGRAPARATWSDLAAHERRAQHARGLAAIAGFATLAVVSLRRRGLSWRSVGASVAWMGVVVAVHVGGYVALRGSFDATSINARATWIRAALALGMAVGAAGIVAHTLLFRDAARARADQLTLVAVGVLADLAHATAYGWPLGYPLPPAPLLFFPFFVASFVVSHAAVAGVTAVTTGAIAWLRAHGL